jgi:hypothetical protein
MTTIILEYYARASINKTKVKIYMGTFGTQNDTPSVGILLPANELRMKSARFAAGTSA